MVFLFTAHLTVLKRSVENSNLLVREYTNPHKISPNSPLLEITGNAKNLQSPSQTSVPDFFFFDLHFLFSGYILTVLSIIAAAN